LGELPKSSLVQKHRASCGRGKIAKKGRKSKRPVPWARGNLNSNCDSIGCLKIRGSKDEGKNWEGSANWGRENFRRILKRATYVLTTKGIEKKRKAAGIVEGSSSSLTPYLGSLEVIGTAKVAKRGIGPELRKGDVRAQNPSELCNLEGPKTAEKGKWL